jgi:hypothetical protein
MMARERTRSLRLWRPATLLLVVVVTAASAVAWKAARARGFGRPFKVLRLTAEAGAERLRSEMPERVTGEREVAARQSLVDVGRRIGARMAAIASARRIDGTTFIASVEQESPLSPAQRTRLKTTLQLAAKVQTTIDATDDPATRADLQRRLDDQVRTRLRLILPKEAQALVSEVDEGGAGGPVAFQFREDQGGPGE